MLLLEVAISVNQDRSTSVHQECQDHMIRKLSGAPSVSMNHCHTSCLSFYQYQIQNIIPNSAFST